MGESEGRSFCTLTSQNLMVDASWISLNHDFHGYLIFDLAGPWHRKVDLTPHFPSKIAQKINELAENGIKIKVLCVKPDSNFTPEGHQKAIYYENPSFPFSQLEKHEYDFPEDEFEELTSLLLSNKYEKLAGYKVTKDSRDFFVCNHSKRDSCCGKFGIQIYKRMIELTHDASHYRVWTSSHLGGHRLAPTLMEMPQARFWGYLREDLLENLIFRNKSHLELLDNYRGSMCLDPWSQILEKEAFRREGWEWMDNKKIAHKIVQDGNKLSARLDYSNYLESGYISAEVIEDGILLIPKTDCSDSTELKRYRIENYEKIKS